MAEVKATFGEGWLEAEFDEGIFPKDVIYGAAFTFIDRAYVHLDRVGEGRLKVRLRSKTGAFADAPALAAELEDELTGQAWRKQIAEQGRDLVRDIEARAFGTAPSEPALDDLLSADGADAFEDPLGIAMSWEDKYLKKTEAAGGAAEATPAEGAPPNVSENVDQGAT